ncbi:hypothetical protein BC830DRAFT_1220036 [Chytriomyces sp. MP71]|nr:hypothetical protein BC830DRAFT_1220036 [Chytriomyces sp. MP71]
MLALVHPKYDAIALQEIRCSARDCNSSCTGESVKAKWKTSEPASNHGKDVDAEDLETTRCKAYTFGGIKSRQTVPSHYWNPNPSSTSIGKRSGMQGRFGVGGASQSREEIQEPFRTEYFVEPHPQSQLEIHESLLSRLNATRNTDCKPYACHTSHVSYATSINKSYQPFHFEPSSNDQILHAHPDICHHSEIHPSDEYSPIFYEHALDNADISRLDRNAQYVSESTMPKWSSQELDLTEEQMNALMSHFEDDISTVQSDFLLGGTDEQDTEQIETLQAPLQNKFAAPPPRLPQLPSSVVVSHSSLSVAHHQISCAQPVMNPTPAPTRGTTPSLRFRQLEPSIVSRQTNLAGQYQHQGLHLPTVELMPTLPPPFLHHPIHGKPLLQYQPQERLHQVAYPTGSHHAQARLDPGFVGVELQTAPASPTAFSTVSTQSTQSFPNNLDSNGGFQSFACAQKAQYTHTYAPPANHRVHMPQQHMYHPTESFPAPFPAHGPTLLHPNPAPMTSGSRRRTQHAKQACNPCRSSNKKCQDTRPCLRCVQRGMAHACVDAPRRPRVARKRGPYRKSLVPAGLFDASSGDAGVHHFVGDLGSDQGHDDVEVVGFQSYLSGDTESQESFNRRGMPLLGMFTTDKASF